MKQITAILLGAGNRGQWAYGPWALEHPDELKFVAVAEPDEVRREMFCKAHGIPAERSFADWKDLLGLGKIADAALICTQDTMHFEPTVAAIEAGYHILLEKPISPSAQECVAIGDLAAQHPDQVVSVCHVLRYTNFFSKIKELIDSGVIGDVMTMVHNESVCYWHQAHSFVRGHWRNSKESSPMILAKSCHDMDIMLWLMGKNCVKVSSFGDLGFFKAENAPEGAPLRCTDGCPAADSCAYNAVRVYNSPTVPDFMLTALTQDPSPEGRRKVLEEGPYGRCVFHCDNDVVDHQVVNMLFEDGATATFSMTAFTHKGGRSLRVMGTKGEIRATSDSGDIQVRDFLTDSITDIKIAPAGSGHGGGDEGIIADFVRLVASQSQGRTSAQQSIQSHIMALAAERSRVEGKVITLSEFMDEMRG